MPCISEQEFTYKACKGYQPAIDLCNQYFHVCQVWDDLIDKDRPLSDTEINNTFISALFEIPSNHFYRANFDYLKGVMFSGVIDWMDANDLEKGTDHQKMVAYTLRDNFNNLLIHCAYLIGGKAWMHEIRKQLRLDVYDESLDAYMESLK